MARWWRLFYVILRNSGDGKKGEILVVTKVNDKEGCHVAYIDALANKNANVIARNASDNIAPLFRCGHQQPIRLGRVGISPF